MITGMRGTIQCGMHALKLLCMIIVSITNKRGVLGTIVDQKNVLEQTGVVHNIKSQ